MRIVFYIGILLNLLFLGLNVGWLTDYHTHPTLHKTYGYGYFIVYIGFPFLIICASIILGFIYLETNGPKKAVKIIGLSFFLFNAISMMGMDSYLQSKANNIKITFYNESSQAVQAVKIMTRTKQQLNLDNLMKGEEKAVVCPCREVVLPVDEGITLSYQVAGKEFKACLIHPHSSEYDEFLQVRFKSDTLLYRSFILGNEVQWRVIYVTQ
jgi:hypothetical protein